jgi:hypothetical protein
MDNKKSKHQLLLPLFIAWHLVVRSPQFTFSRSWLRSEDLNHDLRNTWDSEIDPTFRTSRIASRFIVLSWWISYPKIMPGILPRLPQCARISFNLWRYQRNTLSSAATGIWARGQHQVYALLFVFLNRAPDMDIFKDGFQQLAWY